VEYCDKYQKILKAAKADIDTENQSGKTGYRKSELYRVLERWRVLSKPIPPLTETPIASSSSSSVSASLSFN
jgi:DNA-directed RNA polymerase subunit M/transcription elongation factor TFIIS